MFFSLEPTPFPGTGELCSNNFYQNITFVNIIFPGFFGFFLILESCILLIKVWLNDQVNKQGKISCNNFFLFLKSAIYDSVETFPIPGMNIQLG